MLVHVTGLLSMMVLMITMARCMVRRGGTAEGQGDTGGQQPGRQAFRCLPCLTAQRKPGILVTILHGLSFCGH